LSLKYNWATLQNGATFHALVNILLLHEDPRARVFTKEGPDGGLDAISPQWSTAYQAKFHADNKSHHAFSDAKKELKKIKEYRDPEHERYELWKGVTAWKLVTNVQYGSDEAKRWDDEIKPLFKAEGVDAEWTTVADLEKRLASHPDVAECFFEGKPRSFLSLEEFRTISTGGVLEDAFDRPLQHRGDEVDRLLAFVGDPDPAYRR
jgi:hypothetical protein